MSLVTLSSSVDKYHPTDQPSSMSSFQPSLLSGDIKWYSSCALFSCESLSLTFSSMPVAVNCCDMSRRYHVPSDLPYHVTVVRSWAICSLGPENSVMRLRWPYSFHEKEWAPRPWCHLVPVFGGYSGKCAKGWPQSSLIHVCFYHVNLCIDILTRSIALNIACNWITELVKHLFIKKYNPSACCCWTCRR